MSYAQSAGYVMLPSMEMSLQQSIGLNVRSARVSKGLTQGQLAERIGCAWETISRIERGKNPPTVNILYDIAKILGVSFDELVLDVGRSVSPSRFRKESEAISILRSFSDESLEMALRIMKAMKKEKDWHP